MKVICKSNECVYINSSHLQYFDLLYNQYHDTDSSIDYIKYEVLNKSNVEKTYNYLICLLQNDNINIPTTDFCNILMTADFLICDMVVKDVIKKIQNIIKYSKDYLEIQQLLNIEYKWGENELRNKKDNDKWCTPINGCKSKFLKKY